MAYRAHVVKNEDAGNPYAGSSLVPMLIRARADVRGDDRGGGSELTLFPRHCLRKTRSVCAREQRDEAIHLSVTP